MSFSWPDKHDHTDVFARKKANPRQTEHENITEETPQPSLLFSSSP